MLQLTQAQAAILGPLILLVGGGIGYFVKRRITRASDTEALDHMGKIADLLAKLKAAGFSDTEVRQWAALLRSPALFGSKAVGEIVEDVAEDESQEDPEEYMTNAAMKMRTGASNEIANAKLEQALTDLKLLLSEAEQIKLMDVQQRWTAYRDALADYQRQMWEGGTHAPLAAAMVALAETERRAGEIEAEIAERRSL